MAEVACGRRSFRLSAVVAAAVAVLTIAAPVLVADAATGDAIANPSFETSTSGWNTNGSFSSNGSPPLAPGASTLDYTAYVANAAPGTCFYADDAAIAYQT